MLDPPAVSHSNRRVDFSLTGRILGLAIPATLTSQMDNLASIADLFMISFLGSEAISAIGISRVIMEKTQDLECEVTSLYRLAYLTCIKNRITIVAFVQAIPSATTSLNMPKSWKATQTVSKVKTIKEANTAR